MNRMSIIRGEDGKLCFTITKADGSAEDLGDFSTASFIIKRSNLDPDSAAIFTGTLADADIEYDDPTTLGKLTVTVPHEITEDMRVGQPYYYRLTIIGTPGTFVPNAGELFVTYKTE